MYIWVYSVGWGEIKSTFCVFSGLRYPDLWLLNTKYYVCTKKTGYKGKVSPPRYIYIHYTFISSVCLVCICIYGLKKPIRRNIGAIILAFHLLFTMRVRRKHTTWVQNLIRGTSTHWKFSLYYLLGVHLCFWMEDIRQMIQRRPRLWLFAAILRTRT